MAWSPLGGGSLFIPGDRIGDRIMPRLREIADIHDVAPDAVALAWLLAHPAGIVPVVGTNTLSRIRKIADAMKVSLDRETWFELLILAQGRDMP